jgi:hypothetical protein
MTAPEPETTDDDQQSDDQSEVPPVSPAYATPPPEGLPDADKA